MWLSYKFSGFWLLLILAFVIYAQGNDPNSCSSYSEPQKCRANSKCYYSCDNKKCLSKANLTVHEYCSQYCGDECGCLGESDCMYNYKDQTCYMGWAFCTMMFDSFHCVHGHQNNTVHLVGGGLCKSYNSKNEGFCVPDEIVTQAFSLNDSAICQDIGPLEDGYYEMLLTPRKIVWKKGQKLQVFNATLNGFPLPLKFQRPEAPDHLEDYGNVVVTFLVKGGNIEIKNHQGGGKFPLKNGNILKDAGGQSMNCPNVGESSNLIGFMKLVKLNGTEPFRDIKYLS